jgi:chemotaxis protein MotA
MTKNAEGHNEYLHVLRVLMLSFFKGSAPMVAIEIARRAIPSHVRPTFDEMEKACKGDSAAQPQRPHSPRNPKEFLTANKTGIE